LPALIISKSAKWPYGGEMADTLNLLIAPLAGIAEEYFINS